MTNAVRVLRLSAVLLAGSVLFAAVSACGAKPQASMPPARLLPRSRRGSPRSDALTFAAVERVLPKREALPSALTARGWRRVRRATL